MNDIVTSLNDTIAPEILFHWVGIALCVEKLVDIAQCSDLCTGVAVVDGHNISYTKYVEGMCTKG